MSVRFSQSGLLVISKKRLPDQSSRTFFKFTKDSTMTEGSLDKRRPCPTQRSLICMFSISSLLACWKKMIAQHYWNIVFCLASQIGGLSTVQLMLGIFCILVVDIVVLVSWNLIDPMQLKTVEISVGRKRQYFCFSYSCHSSSIISPI